MTETVPIENLVLGGGEAGKYIAWDLAQQGRAVVVIERALVGGSCPNIACLPSKNVIRSAKVADLIEHASSHGVSIGGATVDMNGVRQRKREMVNGMIAIHRKKFAVPHLDFLLAEGRLVGPRTVEARLPDGGSRRFVAERLFLNLGTRATIPRVPGLAGAQPLTHVEALELDRLPSHLIVIGGGYVGVEFAQAFRRFGSQVTVLEFGPQLLGREDPDVAAAVQTIFEEDGIGVVLGADTELVEGRSGNAVRLRVKTPAGARTIEGSDILVAAGRTPQTQEIGLKEAGIALDARGFVKVDDRLRTTAVGVWAMGECAGSPQFTHVAFDDFRVVRDDLAGTARSTRDRLIPYCAFIDPELARVGLDETTAQQQRIAVRVARIPMTSVLRARAIDETRGFMKMLIDADSDRIRGFTMLGANAGEVLAVVQTAMLAGMPYTGLRDAIFTHPTMAEGLNVLLSNVPPDTNARIASRAPARWEGEDTMQKLLIDLDRELASTRRLLERYPGGRGGWQPHDRSRTLSALATHVATIPDHGATILTTSELDVAARQPPPPRDAATELLEAFDSGAARLKSAVAQVDESTLGEKWTMRMGSRVLVSESRAMLMRLMVINHLVHHRAQLGVYLRLLNVPIPGMYGPSADEPV